ncbi:hypothetical protein FD737_14230 [Pantoea sp. Seng]|uniref:DUF6932 family protein n=1 Tax=Pantoea sp. Seng TaxID=2576761 RepID=UPI0013298DC3|nr:hypothetical protein [Pantoea sp. Seng]MXP54227.1 hypothetical protein [Pantoea sp. Seng]
MPSFDVTGYLPQGIHFLTWDELKQQFGYNPKRAFLLDGLELLIQNLRFAGCKLIYIDGSFVTNKELPGDYDMAWSIVGVDPSKLDPCLLLNNGKKDRDLIEKRYRGDVFPAEFPEGASGKIFRDFFQEDRDGNPKGIVAINI